MAGTGEANKLKVLGKVVSPETVGGTERCQVHFWRGGEGADSERLPYFGVTGGEEAREMAVSARTPEGVRRESLVSRRVAGTRREDGEKVRRSEREKVGEVMVWRIREFAFAFCALRLSVSARVDGDSIEERNGVRYIFGVRAKVRILNVCRISALPAEKRPG